MLCYYISLFFLWLCFSKVNGFYGARGAAGAIPYLYTQVARQFHQQLCAFQQKKRIQLFEYYRSKWTFHVKGLWYYVDRDPLPSLTLIGSSNFGKYWNRISSLLKLNINFLLIVWINSTPERKSLHLCLEQCFSPCIIQSFSG